MKSVRLCKGCGRRILVNTMGLCKRCNREAFRYISKVDMERMMREHVEMLRAAKEIKAAEKEEEVPEKAMKEEKKPGKKEE